MGMDRTTDEMVGYRSKFLAGHTKSCEDLSGMKKTVSPAPENHSIFSGNPILLASSGLVVVLAIFADVRR
jgi:hypothetical protein